MQIHVLVTFTSSAVFHKARTPAFYLYATSCLLLNMLDIRTTMPYDLGAKIETWERLEVDGDPLLGPFALEISLRIKKF